MGVDCTDKFFRKKAFEKNNSAHPSPRRVFTQPGSKADLKRRKPDVLLSPKNRHRQRVGSVEQSDTHDVLNIAMGFAKQPNPTVCCLTGCLICPTGKSVTASAFALSSPDRKNISVFPKSNPLYILAVPFPMRGVSRSSQTWRGMRWTLMAPLTNGA